MGYDTGEWCTNHICYKPSLTTQGTDDYADFNTSQDNVDAILAGYGPVIGQTGYTTLDEALTTIGSTDTVLRVPSVAGAVAVTAGGTVTIPSNVQLVVDNGAYFDIPTGTVLAINGPIEAGSYQIFSWTGTGSVDLSGCPTADIPIQWFGGVSGTTEDNGAVFSKIAAAIGAGGSQHTIYLSAGIWGIQTDQIITGNTYGLKFRGDGRSETQIYINTPGTIGLTFGSVGVDQFGFEFKYMSVVGPASACTNAIKMIRCHNTVTREFNFYVGSTSYALYMSGCLWQDLGVEFCRDYGFSGYDLPADGLKIDDDAYGANVVKVHVIASGGALGSAVHANSTVTGVSTVFECSGSIENCTSYPVYVEGFYVADIHNMYLVDGNAYGPYVKDCKTVIMRSLDCTQDSDILTTLENVWGATLIGTRFANLVIDSQCRGVKIIDCEVSRPNGLINSSPDLEITSLKYRDGGYAEAMQSGMCSDRQNYIENALFTRWSTGPVGWGSGASFTQCGTGLVDTTNRATPYCVKFETSGGDVQTDYPISADALLAVKGKVANFTVWQKLDELPNTFSDFPIAYLGPTSPNWANTTYAIGDAVIPVAGDAGYMYVCVVAGTSDAVEPTWSTTLKATQTDGTVTWKVYPSSYSSYNSMPGSSDDIGVWKRVSVGGFIPGNATAVTVSYLLRRRDGPADSYVYLSEPTLMVGWQGPDSAVSNRNEHQSSIFLGGSKFTIGPTAGEPASPLTGDIYLINDVGGGTTAVLEYYNGAAWVTIASTP